MIKATSLTLEIVKISKTALVIMYIFLCSLRYYEYYFYPAGVPLRALYRILHVSTEAAQLTTNSF